ncbi:DUF2207 domain-containing protein [Sediminicola arcticus]|jgi:uncharacterized membrane protein|uniref:DUF2207 domain-containing protein n=1 Tax=Sediminicola arcticus TaxID=1574308 RepID=A0ABV2SU11_9FLAO
MKKCIVLFMILLVFSIGKAQDFMVTNYTVDITINTDGYFDVKENYDLNFEIPKHGIYRTIQTQYDLLNFEGKKEDRKIRISHVNVPNYKFDVPFDFVQKLQDNMDIKIGDKDVTLIGPQHYEIAYRVHNAFLFEENQIRFYWNIKPDGWQADFEQISFRIHVPENITLNQENCFVYAGDKGTSTTTQDFKLYYSNAGFSGTSNDNFMSHAVQSVTVMINLPPNSVAEEKPLWPFWNQYGWSFLVGLLVIGFYALWRKFGKDDKVITSTSYYPPKQMDPAMVGFLINDRDDNSDLISLIPSWGAKGLIKMEEIPKKGWFSGKDTKLIRIGLLPENSPSYEKEIFNGLFGNGDVLDTSEIVVSSLKDTFYTTMSSARSKLKESALPYYVVESKKVQTLLYFGLVAMAIFLTTIALFVWGPLAAVAIVLTCIILMILNGYMIKKNDIGNQVLSELKGFRQFIKVAEENKLKMLLKEDSNYFENTMAYALAFGLFDKWAKKFDALHIPPPSWYSTTSSSAYTMHSFSKSFSKSMVVTQSTMVSSPQSSGSSGGGSSGGGFGGGGGGSW